MQSPTAVAFRALIMLVCLVAVPLVAVFNAPLREWLHKAIDSHKAVADARVPASAGTAPLFNDPNASPYRAATASLPINAAGQPLATAAPAPLANLASAGGNNAANLPLAMPGGFPTVEDPQIARSMPLSAAGNDAARGNAPLDDSARFNGGNANSAAANSYSPPMPGAAQRPGAPNFAVSQANFEQNAGAPRGSAAEFGLPAANESLRRQGNPADAGPTGNSAGKTPPPSPDSFKQIERRIQDLGATYYRLEADGTGTEPYHFCCMVSMAGDANHIHRYEARDSDPLRAMEKVLHEVEGSRR